MEYHILQVIGNMRHSFYHILQVIGNMRHSFYPNIMKCTSYLYVDENVNPVRTLLSHTGLFKLNSIVWD